MLKANSSTTSINQTNSAASLNYRPWDFGEASLLFLLIFGTLTNTLSIIIINRKHMRTSTASLFITFMAIFDILFLLIKFTSNMVKLYRMPIYSACIFVHGLLPDITMFMSVWLIILTSLERYVAVTNPFKVHAIFSQSRSLLIIGAMATFFFLLSATKSVCMQSDVLRPQFCKVRGQPNGTFFYYYNYVFPWMSSSIGSWLPSLLGLGLNVAIVRAMVSAKLVRGKMANVPSGYDRAVTKNSNYGGDGGGGEKNKEDLELFVEKKKKNEAIIDCGDNEDIGYVYYSVQHIVTTTFTILRKFKKFNSIELNIQN